LPPLVPPPPAPPPAEPDPEPAARTRRASAGDVAAVVGVLAVASSLVVRFAYENAYSPLAVGVHEIGLSEVRMSAVPAVLGAVLLGWLAVPVGLLLRPTNRRNVAAIACLGVDAVLALSLPPLWWLGGGLLLSAAVAVAPSVSLPPFRYGAESLVRETLAGAALLSLLALVLVATTSGEAGVALRRTGAPGKSLVAVLLQIPNAPVCVVGPARGLDVTHRYTLLGGANDVVVLLDIESHNVVRVPSGEVVLRDRPASNVCP
jgi:hypothetical protein